MAPAAKAPHPQQPPRQRADALSFIMLSAAIATIAIAAMRAKLTVDLVM
jgi:hypothetical protein